MENDTIFDAVVRAEHLELSARAAKDAVESDRTETSVPVARAAATSSSPLELARNVGSEAARPRTSNTVLFELRVPPCRRQQIPVLTARRLFLRITSSQDATRVSVCERGRPRALAMGLARPPAAAASSRIRCSDGAVA